MSGKSKLKRYHKDVFFPEWTETSLEQFVTGISRQGALTFSLHSVEKTAGYLYQYGMFMLKFLSEVIRGKPLDVSKIFEFYALGEVTKKAVFRYSFERFPVDIVLVISADGVIITVYVIDKQDFHSTCDLNLYERG